MSTLANSRSPSPTNMRLIDISRLDKLRFREVTDPNDVHYAILSHVWNNNEPTFRDLELVMQGSDGLPEKDPKFTKLIGFIRAAAADGFRFVWADMCCIDQRNSDEVTAAAASMYSWYSSAEVCYVFLRDVPFPHHEQDTLPPSPPAQFSRSVWFKRAWTLQELLAPRSLVFFSTDWKFIGTKHNLSKIIQDVTGIDVEVLTGKREVQEVSVARRMSWAENRTASKPEDRAYALMGIFGVRIPVLYGEGDHAFVRLQQEILRRCPDPTLLAWGLLRPLSSPPLALTEYERIREDRSQALMHAQARPKRSSPLPDRDSSYLFTSPSDVFLQTATHMTTTLQHSSGPLCLAPSRTVLCGGRPSRQNTVPFYVRQMYTPLAELAMCAPLNVKDASLGPFDLIPVSCSTANTEPLALLLYPSTFHTASNFVSSGDHQHCAIGVRTKESHMRPPYTRILRLSPPESVCTLGRNVLGKSEKIDGHALGREVDLLLNTPISFCRADDPRKADVAERLLHENGGPFSLYQSGWCKFAQEILAVPRCNVQRPSKNTASHAILLFRSRIHALHISSGDRRGAVEGFEAWFASCLLRHHGLPCGGLPPKTCAINEDSCFPLVGSLISHTAPRRSRTPHPATSSEGRFRVSYTVAVNDHIGTCSHGVAVVRTLELTFERALVNCTSQGHVSVRSMLYVAPRLVERCCRLCAGRALCSSYEAR